MESVKDGLSHKEKISQKKPGKHDDMTNRPMPVKEKAPSGDKPGNFTFK